MAALRDYYAGHVDSGRHMVEVVAEDPAELGVDKLQLAVVMLETRHIESASHIHVFC